jgi:PEP-CTERM motif-containing protein
MRERRVLVIVLAVFALANGKVVQATPSLVTETQSFVMTGDAKVSRTPDPWAKTTTRGLEFSGRPGSIVTAGKPARLTSVSFDLTTDLFYMINVNAVDGTEFSDCYTKASYVLSLGVLYPDQYRPLYSDHAIVEVSDRSYWLSRSWDNWHKEVHTGLEQSFSISADDCDLSFLDDDSYTVELKRGLLMYLLGWDTNDSLNFISMQKFTWKGDLTITYQYEDAPVPTPVPLPSAMLLLCSGLIGLAGFRRKSRTAPSLS